MEAGRYKRLEDVEEVEDVYLSTADIEVFSCLQPNPSLYIVFLSLLNRDVYAEENPLESPI